MGAETIWYQMKKYQIVFWITTWYVCTSLSNIEMKQFLRNNNIFLTTFGSLLISMILLPFYKPKYQLIDEKLEDNKTIGYKPFMTLSIFHLCNALFTAFAFKYSSIQFNYTIKAFEPFINGLLSMLLLNSSLTRKQWITLCPIPIGVGLATITDATFSWSALYISLGSVFVTCCRSVLFKKSNLPPFQSFIVLSAISGYLCLGLLVVYSILFGFHCPSLEEFKHLALTSIYYFLYNLSSFMILNELHPVSHAIANVFKRIISILYAWVYFQFAVNPSNILGICIAYTGVFWYGINKASNSKKVNPHSNKTSKSLLTKTSLFLLASVFVLQSYQDTNASSFALPSSYSYSTNNRQVDRLSCFKSLETSYFNVFRQILPKHTSAILVDTPIHENLGDSFIWLGQEMAMSKLGITIDASCTSDRCTPLTTPRNGSTPIILDNVTISNQIILAHGGGNFGDLYPWSNELRLHIMQNFPENMIILFPQSIYYKNESIAIEDASKYKEYKNLHLMARSRRSKEILDTIFHENAHRYLLPDSALLIGSIEPLCTPTKDVLFLKRTDDESIVENVDLLKQSGLHYETKDWFTDEQSKMDFNIYYSKNPSNEARLPKYRLDYSNRLFCQYRVILTDRLHATILALLMDKPVVALENNYGKIGSVLETMEDIGGPSCNSDNLRRYLSPNGNMELAIAKVKEFLKELK